MSLISWSRRTYLEKLAFYVGNYISRHSYCIPLASHMHSASLVPPAPVQVAAVGSLVVRFRLQWHWGLGLVEHAQTAVHLQTESTLLWMITYCIGILINRWKRTHVDIYTWFDAHLQPSISEETSQRLHSFYCLCVCEIGLHIYILIKTLHTNGRAFRRSQSSVTWLHLQNAAIARLLHHGIRGVDSLRESPLHGSTYVLSRTICLWCSSGLCQKGTFNTIFPDSTFMIPGSEDKFSERSNNVRNMRTVVFRICQLWKSIGERRRGHKHTERERERNCVSV